MVTGRKHLYDLCVISVGLGRHQRDAVLKKLCLSPEDVRGKGLEHHRLTDL